VPFVTPMEWDSTPQNVNRRSLGTVGKREAKSDGWYKGGWMGQDGRRPAVLRRLGALDKAKEQMPT
jgi:hypothetical protein